MARFCKRCGEKIPRKIPHTGKKTKVTRKSCYNCSPVRQPKNDNPKEYKSERRKRKESLIKILGGKCSECGYHKSISALSFHHKYPKKKKFDISNNGNLMKDWIVVLREAKKCKILCLNCHSEAEEIIRNNKK